jgi:hypothetical protein
VGEVKTVSSDVGNLNVSIICNDVVSEVAGTVSLLD